MSIWLVFLSVLVIGVSIALFHAVRSSAPAPPVRPETRVPSSRLDELLERVESLETEVDDLKTAVTSLQEENEVLQQIVDHGGPVSGGPRTGEH